jgi:hypothetical protein
VKAQLIAGHVETERMMWTLLIYLGNLRRIGQAVGPYLLLEILMPGGTLLALLLFLYRRRRVDIESAVARAADAVTRAVASLFGQGIVFLRLCYVPTRPSPRSTTIRRTP